MSLESILTVLVVIYHMVFKKITLSIGMTKPMINIIIITGRTDMFRVILLEIPANYLLPIFCDISFHTSYFISWCEVYFCPWTQNTVLCKHCMIYCWVSICLTLWSSRGFSCSWYTVHFVYYLLNKILVKVLLNIGCLCTLFVNQSGTYHIHCKYW